MTELTSPSIKLIAINTLLTQLGRMITSVFLLAPTGQFICLRWIIKSSCVISRTDTQSHFLLSFLCLCVWFLSLHRKQGSASPAPASPATKAEKKCILSCLRHKRSIKRVGWPRDPGRPKNNPQSYSHCDLGDHQPSNGKVHSDDLNLNSQQLDWRCWRIMVV